MYEDILKKYNTNEQPNGGVYDDILKKYETPNIRPAQVRTQRVVGLQNDLLSQKQEKKSDQRIEGMKERIRSAGFTLESVRDEINNAKKYLGMSSQEAANIFRPAYQETMKRQGQIGQNQARRAQRFDVAAKAAKGTRDTATVAAGLVGAYALSPAVAGLVAANPAALEAVQRMAVTGHVTEQAIRNAPWWQQLIARGVRGAVPGAVYGAGYAASEAKISKRPVLPAAKHGALQGAAIGGTAGVLTSGGQQVLQAAQQRKAAGVPLFSRVPTPKEFIKARHPDVGGKMTPEQFSKGLEAVRRMAGEKTVPLQDVLPAILRNAVRGVPAQSAPTIPLLTGRVPSPLLNLGNARKVTPQPVEEPYIYGLSDSKPFKSETMNVKRHGLHPDVKRVSIEGKTAYRHADGTEFTGKGAFGKANEYAVTSMAATESTAQGRPLTEAEVPEVITPDEAPHELQNPENPISHTAEQQATSVEAQPEVSNNTLPEITVPVTTEDGTKVNVRYRLADANDLVTSNDEGYITELQPRDRDRKVSLAQIMSIAANPDPERLSAGATPSPGAPIVGEDNIVESGNGRVLGLRKAYSAGTAEKYRQYLIDYAEEYGLDPAQIASMKRPVLVRERISDVDRVQFAREANRAGVLAMSATEQAVDDAGNVQEIIQLFNPGENGDVATPGNRRFIQEFFRTAVGKSDYGNYLTGDGQLSQAGISRIKNAVFAAAYKDPGIIARVAEDPDNNIRNITNGLMAAVPTVARVEGKISKSQAYPLSISSDVTAAINKLGALRKEGVSVDEYINQGQLFDDDVSDLAKSLLVHFDNNKRRPSSIANLLKEYYDLLEKAGTPGATLFDIKPPTPDELLARAMEKVANGELSGSLGLFEGQTGDDAQASPLRLREGEDPYYTAARRAADELISGSAGELERSGKPRTIAVGINADLVETSRTDLRGKIVNSVDDLAILGQVYRDPRYETLRIFYVGKNNDILAHEGFTIRMPGSATFPIRIEKVVNGKPKPLTRDTYRIKNRMDRLGATGFYFMHNHPSGDPTPSPEDSYASELISDGIRDAYKGVNAPKYSGHVVINSGVYSFIDPHGTVTRNIIIPGLPTGWVDELLTPTKDHPVLKPRRALYEPGIVASVGRELKPDKDVLVLIYTSSKGKVRAIEDMPLKTIKKTEALSNYIWGRIKDFGSNRVFGYCEAEDASALNDANRLIENGTLGDFIISNSRGDIISSWVDYHTRPTPGYEHGRYTSARGKGTALPLRVAETEDPYGDLLEDIVPERKKKVRLVAPLREQPGEAASASIGITEEPPAVATRKTPSGKIKVITDRAGQPVPAAVQEAVKKAHDKGAFSLNRETMSRNIEDIFGKDAEVVKDYLTRPIARNETERNDFVNQQVKFLRENLVQRLQIKPGSRVDRMVFSYIEGNIPQERISKLGEKMRQRIEAAAAITENTYSELLQAINAELRTYGYPTIPKRQNYVTHIREINSFLDVMGSFFNVQPWKLQDVAKPVFTKPGKEFFQYALPRAYDNAKQSVLEALDAYIDKASYQIYHIDSVQRARTLEKVVNASMDAGEVVLNNYRNNLHQYGDILAGKGHWIDKAVENQIGKTLPRLTNWIRRRLSSNMIAGNVGAALTNFIPITQASATTTKVAFMKGAGEAVFAPFVTPTEVDGVTSGFLTRRYSEHKIAPSRLEKASRAAGFLFKLVDEFSAHTIVRGKYYELIGKGMDPKEAMEKADDFAARVITDRSRGQLPNWFESKTYGLLFQFQTEVNNQFSFLLKDIPRMTGGDKRKIAAVFAQVLLYSWLFNNLYETLARRRPAPDPIGMIADYFKDTANASRRKAFFNFVKDVGDQAPFISALTGGRIPLNTAFPKLRDLEEGGAVMRKALLSTAFYLLPPFGGGQLKKTLTGLAAVSESGMRTPTGRLKFPVDNALQAVLFGPYASKYAEPYYRYGQKPLNTGPIPNNVYESLREAERLRKQR